MSLILRFELSAYGRPYHAARSRLEPGALNSVMHGHADFHELMAVVGGRGQHLLGTRSVPLEYGDVVLVRPRDQHAMNGLPPDGLEFINVAFPTAVWHGFLDLARSDPGWDAGREPPVLRPEPDAMVAVFEEVLRRFRDGPSLFDLIRFWTDLLPLVLPGAAPAYGTRPDWLVDACTAMRREDNLRGGVPRMLELAGVSPAHLSRSMRSHYATTPTAYIADLRLEHAAALLAATTEPVATIASRCGFASQSYFTRCFSAAHQVPPREFRRLARQAFVP